MNRKNHPSAESMCQDDFAQVDKKKNVPAVPHYYVTPCLEEFYFNLIQSKEADKSGRHNVRVK